MGLAASIEPRLADLDYGAWSGHRLEDVEPEALAGWLADPSRTPPDGETMADLLLRVGDWMDDRAGDARTLLAVSHAAVLRAALAHALATPVASMMRVDITPLSSIALSFNRQWRLQELRRDQAKRDGACG